MSYKPLRVVSLAPEDDEHREGKSEEEHVTLLHHEQHRQPSYAQPRSWIQWKYLRDFLLIVLMMSNLVLLWRDYYHIHDLLNSKGDGNEGKFTSYLGPPKKEIRIFHWTTEYSGNNVTETSLRWQNLFPIGDGLVTLEDTWSASQKLPPSVKRYKNSTQSIYLVAAYHQLHCLTILRSVIYKLKEGLPLTVPFAHATHCLDSLRQSTMCHADNTLLYTQNTHTYGDGQGRVCNDWGALEQWTREHRIHVPTLEALFDQGAS